MQHDFMLLSEAWALTLCMFLGIFVLFFFNSAVKFSVFLDEIMQAKKTFFFIFGSAPISLFCFKQKLRENEQTLKVEITV